MTTRQECFVQRCRRPPVVMHNERTYCSWHALELLKEEAPVRQRGHIGTTSRAVSY